MFYTYKLVQIKEICENLKKNHSNFSLRWHLARKTGDVLMDGSRHPKLSDEQEIVIAYLHFVKINSDQLRHSLIDKVCS